MKKSLDIQTVEGYHPELGLLLATLQDSTREWRENLGKVSDRAVTWQVFENGPSIGALILHMIDCESYWFESFCNGQRRNKDETKLWMSDEVRQYGPHWPVPHAKPISWYFAEQDRIRERATSALRQLDPETVIPRKNYECTVRWVVAHVVEHDSYTGGQAVLVHEMWKKLGRKARD